MALVDHGLKLIGGVLHFEGVPLADIDQTPGLYPSQRARLDAYVQRIEGDPKPSPSDAHVDCPHCGDSHQIDPYPKAVSKETRR